MQTRVGIIGPLRQPELQLTSVPPLDESDILSLIVFNTSTNQLTTRQQQELAGPCRYARRRVSGDADHRGFVESKSVSTSSQVETGTDPSEGLGQK